MATSTFRQAARDMAQLASDMATADALRSTWSKRPSTQRSGCTKVTATAHPCDGDDYDACGCEVEPAGAPSALIDSAWLGEVVTALRDRARELDEWVTEWRELGEPETLEAYRTLAHELRIAAVRAERQAER